MEERIVGLVSGPYSTGGYHWNVCEVTDGRDFWHEEIFYDTLEEALEDCYHISCGGEFDLEEDYLSEEEEMEIDDGY
jgi:hypothetical protein